VSESEKRRTENPEKHKTEINTQKGIDLSVSLYLKLSSPKV